MEPISAALILAGLAAASASAVYINKKNIEYAQDANDTSIALANTAHQREVRDLQAAGLNPILSASGSGSSVPQLKVPDLINPFANAETSAKSLGESLNGTVGSQLSLARSEASSARDYAIMAHREQEYDQLAKERQAYEDAAAIAAFEPDNQVNVYSDSPHLNQAFAYDNPTWRDLRDKFRKDIKKGSYESSLWRSQYKDVSSIGGDLLDGFATGAKAFKSLKGLKMMRRFWR